MVEVVLGLAEHCGFYDHKATIYPYTVYTQNSSKKGLADHFSGYLMASAPPRMISYVHKVGIKFVSSE